MSRLGAVFTRQVAPVSVALTRAGRSRGRWLWPALGLAVTVTAAGALRAETVITADQAAHSTLGALAPLQRAVRVTFDGPAGAPEAQQAEHTVMSLTGHPATEVLLLDPVRLSGVIVRPVAISPLGEWLAGRASDGAVGRCRQIGCRMLRIAGGAAPAVLRAYHVRIEVVGHARLISSVPLGFMTAGDGSWPLLATSDPAGLDRIEGLNGLYRVHSWVAIMPVATLHSWNLAAVTDRLAAAQAALLDRSQQFTLDAPFAGIAAARASARAVPARLELLGGAMLVIVALFVLIGAAGLRVEQRAEIDRLNRAGATVGQTVTFVAAEAALLSAAGVLGGAAASVGATALLAGLAGEPVWGILSHSLLTPAGGLALAGGWLIATVLLAVGAHGWNRRLLDVAGVGGALALAAGLTVGPSSRGAWPAVLPAGCCLAAGLVVGRLAVPAFRRLGRLVRAGPVSLRLAIVGLGREPGLPAFAVAMTTIAIGLGGFALSYRSTLARSAADQAADRVPLDALIGPGASERTPLQVAALPRWAALAGGGTVLPVQRTYATYASATGSVTEPALGVPAAGLRLLHGWRRGDGSAPLAVLARRLRAPGALRRPGPTLPGGTTRLSITADSPDIAVTVLAELRDRAGAVRQVPFGDPGAQRRVLTAVIPAGNWEVEAIEITESAGVEATNGHQNAENPGSATQEVERLMLGPLSWRDGSRERHLSLARWVAVGAVSNVLSGRPASPRMLTGEAELRFAASGFPGVLRPRQPSDSRPVPVLTDAHTAAAAGRDGTLALTIDELPVRARVVGVLRRFPTVAPTDGGFVIADQGELAAALDAQLPGQGVAGELWIATRHPDALRRAMGRPAFVSLTGHFRDEIERGLLGAPVARAERRILLAASLLTALLAVLGLLLVGLGPLRDRVAEADLEALGLGPGALRRELLARLATAPLLAAAPGVAIAVALSALAVGAVGGAQALGSVWPPLVAVVPWLQLAVWTGAIVVAPILAGWLARASSR